MLSCVPSSVLNTLTMSFVLPTANPLAPNPHLSHVSQTFLLPIPITSVDTDSPQPLLLALKTSLAFISPNLNLLVALWLSQSQWQQLSDETTAERGRAAPWRERPREQPCDVPSQPHGAAWAEPICHIHVFVYSHLPRKKNTKQFQAVVMCWNVFKLWHELVFLDCFAQLALTVSDCTYCTSLYRDTLAPHLNKSHL